MGEIFRYERSTVPLEFTGERLTTVVGGQVELEHIHRYLMARSLCRGKDVLDIASGEGYGTAILAQVARNVIGVEVDHGTVAHAAASYKRPNLRFVRGDARRIPLPDASVDAVTSFETLEHFLEHGDFFLEANRVLRPEGFLLVSTPDCDVCSPSGCPANPFHVRELSRDEFFSQLSAYFPSVSTFRQRPLIGSLIARTGSKPVPVDLVTYERRDESFFEQNTGVARAPYLVAVASKALSINDGLFSSVFIDTDRVDTQWNELRVAKAEVTDARNAIIRLQDSNAQALAEETRLRDEIARLEKVRNHLTEELNAIRTSSSWRLTGPIRGLVESIRHLHA